MMLKRTVQIAAAVFGAILLFSGRLADMVGRSTAVDDANQLAVKLADAFDWVSRTDPLWALIVGVVLIVASLGWAAFDLYRHIDSKSLARRLAELESVEGWSVSFEIGGAVIFSPHKRAIGLTDCTFRNLSKTISRTIDFEVHFKAEERYSPLILETRYSRNLLSEYIAYNNTGKTADWGWVIQFPLKLAPLEMCEGQVAFHISDSEVELYKKAGSQYRNVGLADLYATDRVSNVKVGPLKIYSSYDARTGKVSSKFDRPKQPISRRLLTGIAQKIRL